MGEDYCVEERNVFSKTLTKVLSELDELEDRLPLTHANVFFFEELADGIIFIYLLNMIDEDLIDMRSVNCELEFDDEKRMQNLNIVHSAAVGVAQMQLKDAKAIAAATAKQKIEMVWQFLYTYYERQITLEHYPELLQIFDYEAEFASMSLEGILIRWMNYHLLAKSGI